MSTPWHARAGWQAEAQRQQGLWAALQSPQGAPEHPAGAVAWRGPHGAARTDHGLRAGQAHAQASAWRAVTARYPVLAEWLGDEVMQALARDLWQRHPPRVGDLARFGDEAPELLAAQPELDVWPWLADLARLESAVHAARTSADVPQDVLARGLGPLTDGDPDAWCLKLAPGSAWVAAPGPTLAVWQAHAGPDRVAGTAPVLPPLDTARRALPDGPCAGAWVWRQAWRVQVAPLDGSLLAWHQRLLAGEPLGRALAAQWQIEPSFDLSAWWHQAMTHGWVVGCVPAPAIQETP
jgi:hypothetical protein